MKKLTGLVMVAGFSVSFAYAEGLLSAKLPTQQSLQDSAKNSANNALGACQPDIKTYCPGASGSAIVTCLKAQDPKKLSAACSSKLSEAQPAKPAIPSIKLPGQ
jgi:hypothetical protein